jgi:hypothetical protein
MTGSGGVINSTGTFALGNASTNISFNGTQMTLNGNVVNNSNIVTGAVNTNSLAANSATVPISAFTSGSISSSTSTNGWTTVQSVSITTSGFQVYVATASNPVAGIDGSLNLSPANLRIVRDSTVLMTSQNSSFAYSDTPSAGTHTYYYQLQDLLSGAVAPSTSQRSLFVMETKR